MREMDLLGKVSRAKAEGEERSYLYFNGNIKYPINNQLFINLKAEGIQLTFDGKPVNNYKELATYYSESLASFKSSATLDAIKKELGR